MQFLNYLSSELEALKEQGLYKQERIITSRQNGSIATQNKQVINLCANNYLGLAGSQDLVAMAEKALEEFGYGMSSVRFICGTQSVHRRLEEKVSQFLGTEDTILYSSCFDANTGLFETLLSEEDAIISDELNHASIIDGIRLCKAKRFRYRNNNMADLEEKLKEAKNCRYRLIATDGVFSMDGTIANLPGIVKLAETYDAMIMVDDSHAVGFMGPTGRGTFEHHNLKGKIDIITGTFGKALGGASGGYTSAKKPIVDWLRQRSRPYLFSNTLAPVIAAVSIGVIETLERSSRLREKLFENAQFFRKEMSLLGFHLLPGEHPIIPIMTYDAKMAQKMAAELLDAGVYVIGFSYPVVPKDQARIRTQMSAAHKKEDLEKSISSFAKIGKKLGLI